MLKKIIIFLFSSLLFCMPMCAATSDIPDFSDLMYQRISSQGHFVVMWRPDRNSWWCLISDNEPAYYDKASGTLQGECQNVSQFYVNANGEWVYNGSYSGNWPVFGQLNNFIMGNYVIYDKDGDVFFYQPAIHRPVLESATIVDSLTENMQRIVFSMSEITTVGVILLGLLVGSSLCSMLLYRFLRKS